MRAYLRHVQSVENTNESKSKLLGGYLRDRLLANITSHEPAKELVKRSFRYTWTTGRSGPAIVLFVSEPHRYSRYSRVGAGPVFVDTGVAHSKLSQRHPFTW